MTDHSTLEKPESYDIPDHVPAELVHPIHLTYGQEFLAAPHAFMADLHESKYPRIFYSPSKMTAGSWVIPKHEDCFFVLRNPEIFNNGSDKPFPRDPDNYFHLIPAEIEPPHHRKYRAILDPMFSPSSIAKLDGWVRGFANELIDDFIDKGECEFTRDFGRPLPVGVFLTLMGLPLGMRDVFVGWAMGLLHSYDPQVAGRAMREVVDYLESVIREKHDNPDEGAVSAIVNGTIDGKPLSEREIFGFVFFLFIAGLDTVFAVMNNSFLWLARNPERRREILARPDDISQITEELLRLYGVTFSGRMLSHDYEMHGVSMKAGDRVICVLPAANYDPDVFPDPLTVDFDRPRRPILTFTGGPHSCMGAHLARLEMRVAISEFLRRIPEFRIKDGTDIEYWHGGVIGPKEVPLVW